MLVPPGVKAAEAAKAAAEAARVEALMKTPLWMHGLRCGVTVVAILWATNYVSTLLHKRADKLREDEANKIRDDEVSLSVDACVNSGCNSTRALAWSLAEKQ